MSHNVVVTYTNPNGLDLTQNGTGTAAQVIWGGTGVTDTGTTGTLAVGNFTSGQATVTLADEKAEGPVTITVTDAIAGTTGTSNDAAHLPTTNVTWTAAAVSATVSTLVANPTTVTADGTATSTITVTLRDAYGNPVGGKSVSLTATLGTVTQPAAATDANGQTTGTVRSTTAGPSTLSATDVTDTLPLTQTAAVTFTAGAVDAGTSTVTANPTTVTADGVASSTITVTLRDANNNPVAGKTVSLAATLGTVTQPVAVTDSNGQTTGTVRSTTAGPSTLSATDVTDTLPLTQTAAVTFTAGAVDAGTSTVTANPTTVTADGVAASTITVTLRDGSGNPVSGKTVSLAATLGTVTQPVAATNAGGQTTGSITSTTAGSTTITATDTTDTLTVTQTANVTFTAGAVAHFLVSASPTSLAAGTPTTVTVTAHDVNHNVVSTYANPNGLALTQNGTGTAAQILWGGTGVTDTGTTGTLAVGNFTSGQATVTLADEKAEGPVSLTVTDPIAGTTGTTGDAAHPPTTNVTWTAAAVSASGSTVTANPTSVVADGVATSTITVTLVDVYGNPASGKTVSLAATLGTVTQPVAATNAAGQTTGSITSTTAGTSTITATDTTDTLTVTQTASVTFTAGAVSAAASTVSASPATVTADGVASSTITVTLRDANGNPVSGKTVSLAATLGTVTQPVAATNAAGQTTGSITSTTAGTSTITATDTTDTLTVTQTANVAFTAGAVSATVSTVSASPTTVTADGVAASTITVTLRDANGNPVSGKTVSLAATLGTVTQPVAATDVNGQTTGSITSTTAGSATVTATDVTDTLTVTQTASVTFTAGAVSATGSTVTANPTSVTADGVATSTITVTLVDANGNPVGGKTVSLAATLGTVTQPVAATDSNGQTTGSLTSTTAGTSTITATDTTDTLPITQTASVTFTPGAVAHFLVSASPTSLAAGTPTTVTVTAHDVNHNIVPTYANPNGLTLTQTGTGTAAQILWGGTGVTDTGTTGTLAVGNFTSGQATVTLADEKAEGPLTITVTDPIAGMTGSTGDAAHLPTTNVTWTAAAVSASGSTVTANPTSVTADGAAPSTITVTLVDVYGNPASGKSVSLSSSRGVTDGITQPVAATDAAGQTTGSVTSTTAGTSTITATDTTDALPITQSASVTFMAGAVSATVSTVSASPATVTADGVATSTITVTLRDGAGNPVAGKTVTLASSRGAVDTITQPAAATDVNGQATGTVSSTTAGSVTVTATDTTDTMTITQTASVTFIAGPVSAATSTVGAAPGTVAADGLASSTITVTLRDAYGNPVSGKTVSLAATLGTVTQPVTATDVNGQTTGGVTSTTVGTSTITATDATDTLTLTQTASVTFTAPDAPTNLQATDRPNDQGGAITLTWTPSTSPSATAQRIYRSTASTGPFTEAATLTDNTTSTYTDTNGGTGLTNGTTYFYVIRALNAANVESADSNLASAIPTDGVVPAAPTGLTVTDRPYDAGTILDLAWTANTEPDLAGYYVYRALAATGPYTRVTASPVVGTTYADTGLTPYTTYYYQITAIDISANESAPSSPPVPGVPLPDTTPPAQVTDFVASDGETARVTLTWTHPTDVDLAQVIVKRKVGAYPTSHLDGTTVYDNQHAVPGRPAAFVDGGLTAVAYYFAVYVRDTIGNWNDATTAGKNADTGTPVALPFAPQVREMATQADVTLNGVAANDQSGFAVASHGDLNGDGVNDVVIGAENAGNPAPPCPSEFRTSPVCPRGEVRVVFGGTSLLNPLELSTAPLVITGVNPGDRLGTAVATGGDLDGDGVADLVIGARQADRVYPPPTNTGNEGLVYVFFSRTSYPSPLTADQADLIISGPSLSGEMGSFLATDGDLNGDGLKDLVMGAPKAGGGNGAVSILYGRKSWASCRTSPCTIDLATQADVMITGYRTNQFDFAAPGAGRIATGGDVNGDGRSDLVIGASGFSPTSRPSAGAAFVILGRFRFPPTMRLQTDADLTIHGAAAGDQFGSAVSLAGDVNGDGLADLVIGAQQADPGGRVNAGRVYVLKGQTSYTACATTHCFIDLATTPADLTVDGIGAGDQLGKANAVDAAGDVNGDGLADLVMGALFGDPGGRSNAGQAYFVFGRSPLPPTLDLSTQTDVTINGVLPGDVTGYAVSNGGSIRVPCRRGDLLIGADAADPGGRVDAGRTYAVFGPFVAVPPVLSTIGDVTVINGTTTVVTMTACDPNEDPITWAMSPIPSFATFVDNGNGTATLTLSPGVTQVGMYPVTVTAADNGGPPLVDSETFTIRVLGVPPPGPGGGSDTTPPAQTADFNASDGETARVTVTWTHPGDLDLAQVIVKRKLGGYPTSHLDGLTVYDNPAAVPGRPAGFIDGGLAAVTYYYALYSRDVIGNWNDATTPGANADTGTPVAPTFVPRVVEMATQADVVMNGVAANDQSGFAVASHGDVNGDGVNDVAIGAENAGNPTTCPLEFEKAPVCPRGEVRVVFGGAGLLSPLELSTAPLVITGVNPGDRLGTAVATGGDLDGDGVADLVIGARQADHVYPPPTNTGNEGRVYVFFSRASYPSPLTADQADLIISGSSLSGEAGSYLATDGDLNGDGLQDLVIGAPKTEGGNGAVSILYGRKSWASCRTSPCTIDLATQADVMITGYRTNQFDFAAPGAGRVATGGDVNGDGRSDLVIGASGFSPPSRPSAGAAFVILGRSDLRPTLHLQVDADLTIHGAAAGDQFGSAVSLAGDVNGDGLADLVIGAQQADPGGRVSAGQVDIFRGKAAYTACATTPCLIDLAVTPADATINGVAAGDQVAKANALDTAGDVNGDGLADLVMGALFGDPGGRSNAGQAYIVFGQALPPTIELATRADVTLNGILPGDAMGYAVSNGGSIRSGACRRGDLLVGADAADPGGRVDAGQTYAAFGPFIPVPPVLNVIGDVTVIEGTTTAITLTACDPNQDPIAWATSPLPSFATLVNNGDGTATLTLTPGFTDSGLYGVTVVAADNGGPPLVDSETFTIRVRDALPPPDTTAPVAATNVTAIDTPADNGGSITLTWTPSISPDVTEQRIYRSTTSGGPYSPVKIFADNTTSTHIDTGLTNGTTYYYVVRAFDATQESGNSNEASATPADNAAPAAPTAVNAVDTPADNGGSITLTWTPSISADVTQQRVYRSTTSGGPYGLVISLANNTTTTYPDTGLVNGTTYYYIVRAYDGTQESANSIQAAAAPVEDIPAAPTGLGAVDAPADNGGVINLTWTPSSSGTVTTQRVYRSLTSGGPYSLATSFADNTTTTYSDVGLTNGTTYFYIVRAFNGTYESANSNQASAAPVDNLPPAAPTGVNAADVAPDEGGAITLTWTPSISADVVEQRVYRSTTSGGPYGLVANFTNNTTTTYPDTGLVNGTTYYYVVRAYDGTQESADSTQAAAAPVDNLAPVAPTGLNAADVPADNGGAIALAWTPSTSADVTVQRVYRSLTSGGPYSLVTSFADNTTGTYPDSGLTNGTTYYYVIRAFDGTQESPDSIQAAAIPIDNIVPAAPTVLTVADHPADSGGAIDLRWTPSTSPDVIEQRLYRSVTAGGPYTTLVMNFAGNTTSAYTEAGLTNGTTYYYTIVAFDGTQEGPGSNEASAAPADNRVFHFHLEPSTMIGSTALALRQAGPDQAAATITSGDLLNWIGGVTLANFETQEGDPNADLTLPGGTTFSFVVYLHQSTTDGVMFPSVALYKNAVSPLNHICTATGATALTTVSTAYTLTCAVNLGGLTLAPSDRFFLSAGVEITTSPAVSTTATLGVEGVPNGLTDSQLVVPWP